MKISPDIREAFHRKCREANMRITPQREAVYSCLAGDRSHPSADAVHRGVKKKLPGVSFDTVNRTLASFADIGLVKVVEGHGRPKRFDSYTGAHHHFQCVKCAGITDFDNGEFDKLEIPADMQKRFKVTGKKVVLEGFCDKCR